MKKFSGLVFLCGMLLCAPLQADAHFGMVIPSKQVVSSSKDAVVHFDISFWHPFENRGMDMAQPASFKVYAHGTQTDISGALKQAARQGKTTWQGTYTVAKPGLYAFVLEPAPYWEAQEDLYIIHYTKAYVAAFGDAEGWDKPLGLRTEIVPLVKPFALYAGNTFQGQVLLDGKPVSGAMVEVEFRPEAGLAGVAPHDMMVTQTVKADASGVFTYAAPVPGWWGFAALSTAKETREYQGQPKEVELGAVMWTYFHPLPKTEAAKK